MVEPSLCGGPACPFPVSSPSSMRYGVNESSIGPDETMPQLSQTFSWWSWSSKTRPTPQSSQESPFITTSLPCCHRRRRTRTPPWPARCALRPRGRRRRSQGRPRRDGCESRGSPRGGVSSVLILLNVFVVDPHPRHGHPAAGQGEVDPDVGLDLIRLQHHGERVP